MSETRSGGDRRSAPRFCLVAPLDRVFYETKEGAGEARIANLSVTGACLTEVADSLEVDAPIVLRLNVLRAQGAATVSGRVVRIAPPSGAAVAFDGELDEETQQMLSIMTAALALY